MATPASRSTATATLRSTEENSSAKIFIGDAARKFVHRFHNHKPVARQNLGLLWRREFGPAIDPLDYAYSIVLMEILLQPGSANRLLVVESIKVDVIERQPRAGILMHQDKRGRLDARGHTKPFSDAFHELRLSRAKFALQSENPSATSLVPPTDPEPFGLVRTVRHNSLGHAKCAYPPRLISRSPSRSRNLSPAPSIIFPMQVSRRSENAVFHASNKRTASPAATVNSNSKSSPSVKAASKGGLFDDSWRAWSLAARLMGMASESNSAPTFAANRIWRRSPARPSLISIIA